jgi:hypothetical protein
MTSGISALAAFRQRHCVLRRCRSSDKLVVEESDGQHPVCDTAHRETRARERQGTASLAASLTGLNASPTACEGADEQPRFARSHCLGQPTLGDQIGRWQNREQH